MTRARSALALGGLLVLAACAAEAHEVRPAYLELRQTGSETYDLLWKVPARGDRRLGLHVRLPEACRTTVRPTGGYVNDAFVERWSVASPGGLAGTTVRIDGLSGTRTDVLARVERPDGTAQVARLTPARPFFVVDTTPTRTHVAATYLRLGIEHIVGGIDHLLFVLALLLLARSSRALVGTITAFTVAHSITLAAATLGLVHVPSPPVEAAIALSIVLVAVEIVHSRQGRPSLAERWPWMIAFAFGLLHGLGFAGALSEVGLPQNAIPLALLFFNVGVEVGQLGFVAVVLTVVALARRLHVPWPSWAWRIPTYAIGSIAAYWTLERVARF